MNPLATIEKINSDEKLALSLKEQRPKDKGIDHHLIINKEDVFVDVKYEVRPIHVSQIVELARLYSDDVFLVASNYITPNAKQLLREYDINYLDAAGNIRLRLKQGLVFIEGKYNPPASENYRNRAFTKVGAKLIFCFLRRPHYVNVNYRSLAEISTCSLGSISKIADHLRDEKFIITLPTGKLKLVRYQELLEKWTEVLRDRLLPSVLMGKYSFTGKRKWHQVDLKTKIGYKWGGEVAASKLTNNLRPQNYSIFTNKKEKELIKTLRVLPNQEGDIRIYEEFWNDGSAGSALDTVDPILVYGQLMSSGDSRNFEAAMQIKEKFVDEHI